MNNEIIVNQIINYMKNLEINEGALSNSQPRLSIFGFLIEHEESKSIEFMTKAVSCIKELC